MVEQAFSMQPVLLCRYRHQVEGCQLANEGAIGSSARQHSLGAGWQDLFAPSRFCHLPQVKLFPVDTARYQCCQCYPLNLSTRCLPAVLWCQDEVLTNSASCSSCRLTTSHLHIACMSLLTLRWPSHLSRPSCCIRERSAWVVPWCSIQQPPCLKATAFMRQSTSQQWHTDFCTST